MRITTLLTLIAAAAFQSCILQTEKAFYPGQAWPDNKGVHINAHGGGILYHKGTYYWYGEHKIAGKEGNRAMVGVHVYSSKDLYAWKDRGIALQVDTISIVSEIARGCILERPKVIYNDSTGKFVMWFHLELKDKGYESALSGVAVSDKPEGPFKYLGSHRPCASHWPVNVLEIHKQPVSPDVLEHYCGGEGCLPAHPDTVNLLGRDFEKGQMARDMTLFVDEDGTAYHLYSSEENSTLHIAELTPDYLRHTGKYARFFAGRYMEAPTIFKTSDGMYYFIASGCTGWAPNAARMARAKSIWGPWEEMGNPCTGPGSELTFQSQGTFILPVPGKKDAFIFMADRWEPSNPIDGTYVWLPVQFDDDRPLLKWYDSWNLNEAFDIN